MNVAASAPVVSAARSETPTPLWRGRRRNTTIHNAASFCENSADERSDGNTHGCRHNHRLTRLFKQASEQIKHQCCRVVCNLIRSRDLRAPAKVVACRGTGRREAAPLLSKPIVPKSGQSVSQSVISRSRPALTPPPGTGSQSGSATPGLTRIGHSLTTTRRWAAEHREAPCRASALLQGRTPRCTHSWVHCNGERRC